MLSKIIDELIIISKLAGMETLKYHGQLRENDIENKIDNTPVTQADLAAHKIIVENLSKAFPDIPILSEESEKEVFDLRHNFEDFFLVDPIDGTKEFIKESGEYTINIAYIVNHEVRAGVVYLPVTDELYYGTERGSYLIKNGKTLKLPLVPYEENQIRVVSSKSHPNSATDQYIESLGKKYKKVISLQFGSSLKLCKVAEGVADLNPRLGGTSEWDIAAGHAVLLGAGGDIVELGSSNRVKDNKNSLLNPFYEAKRKELL